MRRAPCEPLCASCRTPITSAGTCRRCEAGAAAAELPQGKPPDMLRGPVWSGGPFVLLGLRSMLLVLLVSGCARQNPQDQADLVRLGSALAECHASGARALADAPEDLAALGRLGVSVSSSALEQILAEAWAFVRDIAAQQAGAMLSQALSSMLGPAGQGQEVSP